MILENTVADKTEYQKRIFNEIDNPSERISSKLSVPLHTFAYPYGDTNKMIINHLKEKKYKLGVTVQSGENPAYAHPYMLHRTMVFGDHSLDEFKSFLTVFQDIDLK